MAAIMLGMDFCKTDVQISLWDEDSTSAEPYNLFDTPGGEIIPMMVIEDGEGGFLAGKEAVDYSIKEKKAGMTALYGYHCSGQTGGRNLAGEEWLAGFIGRLFSILRRRYGGASIACIGITGERFCEQDRERFVRAFAALGYTEEQLFFSTHADAFLWYELCENENASKKPSMTLDYDSRGMMSYVLYPMNKERGIPYYLEKTDYTEQMQGGLDGIYEEEERMEKFAQMTEQALGWKELERLYVTGMYVESDAATEILRALPQKERRTFCGRSLYSQGACCHAVRKRFTKPVIGDNRIFHKVSIKAYQGARETFVPLLMEGTALAWAAGEMQVILDDTKELNFRVEDMRSRECLNCAIQPDGLQLRENRTIRLEVAVRFLDLNTLVIKLRDIGFGSLFPATYRVWEQMIHLD